MSGGELVGYYDDGSGLVDVDDRVYAFGVWVGDHLVCWGDVIDLRGVGCVLELGVGVGGGYEGVVG